MRLIDLVGADSLGAQNSEKNRDREVIGLTADSRQVTPGYLFAALPGTRADGRDFIDQAVASGAVALLVPTGTKVAAGDVAVIEDDEPPPASGASGRAVLWPPTRRWSRR